MVPVQYSNIICAERSGFRGDWCAGQYIAVTYNAKKIKKYGPVSYQISDHVSEEGSNRICKRSKTFAKALGTKKEIKDKISLETKMVADVPDSAPSNSKEKNEQKIGRKRSLMLL